MNPPQRWTRSAPAFAARSPCRRVATKVCSTLLRRVGRRPHDCAGNGAAVLVPTCELVHPGVTPSPLWRVTRCPRSARALRRCRGVLWARQPWRPWHWCPSPRARRRRGQASLVSVCHTECRPMGTAMSLPASVTAACTAMVWTCSHGRRLWFSRPSWPAMTQTGRLPGTDERERHNKVSLGTTRSAAQYNRAVHTPRATRTCSDPGATVLGEGGGRNHGHTRGARSADSLAKQRAEKPPLTSEPTFRSCVSALCTTNLRHQAAR